MRKIALRWLPVVALAAGCGGGETATGDGATGDGATGGDLAGMASADLAAGAGDLAGPRDLAGGAGDLAVLPGQGIFPPASPFYQPIDQLAKAGDSDAVINGVQGLGGWGAGRFQIDFSIAVLQADPNLMRRPFNQTGDFYDPDCDPAPMPVPPGGWVEGEVDYHCAGNGDCHLIVVQGTRLYEMWRADIVNNVFNGGCLALWDLSKNYWTPANPPNFSRGDGCSSADAAGLPIAPLLFTADEVKAGEIKHAIRFALPNNRIRHLKYVHPGTHATGAASGGVNTPAYAARWRLKAGYNEAGLPSEGARVVARALKKYGMFLADGGNIALMGQDDRNTAAKWNGLLDSHDLQAILVTDFEQVDQGTLYDWGMGNMSCQRTPINN